MNIKNKFSIVTLVVIQLISAGCHSQNAVPEEKRIELRIPPGYSGWIFLVPQDTISGFKIVFNHAEGIAYRGSDSTSRGFKLVLLDSANKDITSNARLLRRLTFNDGVSKPKTSHAFYYPNFQELQFPPDFWDDFLKIKEYLNERDRRERLLRNKGLL